MNIKFLSNEEATHDNGTIVLLWKFADENGGIRCTETPIDGTEQQAAEIILNSMANT